MDPISAAVAAVVTVLGPMFVKNKLRAESEYKRAAALGCSREQLDNLDDYDDSGKYRGKGWGKR